MSLRQDQKETVNEAVLSGNRYLLALVSMTRSDSADMIWDRCKPFSRTPLQMTVPQRHGFRKLLFSQNYEPFAETLSSQPFIRIFTSSEPGQGKTYCVTKFVDQFEEELPLITVPIAGPTEAAFLLRRFAARPTRGNPCAFHFNIANSAHEDINIFLFQLLILRHIRAFDGVTYMMCPGDAFLIELPVNCTAVHEEKQSLNRKDEIQLVYNKFFVVSPTAFEASAEFVTFESNPLDVKEDDIQFTLQYLNAFATDALKASLRSVSIQLSCFYLSMLVARFLISTLWPPISRQLLLSDVPSFWTSICLKVSSPLLSHMFAQASFVARVACVPLPKQCPS
jgi:hypothetical protein